VVKVSSNSVNKNPPRYHGNNVCSELTHAWTDAQILWKHNASKYYVGRGIL